MPVARIEPGKTTALCLCTGESAADKDKRKRNSDDQYFFHFLSPSFLWRFERSRLHSIAALSITFQMRWTLCVPRFFWQLARSSVAL